MVASGMGTALGGVLLFLVPRPTEALLSVLLGFTAGVMLAATSFSLLVPALERGSQRVRLTGRPPVRDRPSTELPAHVVIRPVEHPLEIRPCSWAHLDRTAGTSGAAMCDG